MLPIVRYMIVCEDWDTDPDNPLRVNVYGLLSNITSVEDPPYPLLFEELCVLLVLTEGRGTGSAGIVCRFEDTGQQIFGTAERTVTFGSDPLAVVGVAFRIRNCLFRRTGLYSIQFWYDNQLVDERPLRLR
jgi:hypothetical protein